LGIDLGIFQLLKEWEGTPISASELAGITGAETQFIGEVIMESSILADLNECEL
jgi:hypothetical protein